jgi:hypothetical protein
MEHVFFCDGNQKRISWIIQSDDSKVEQFREQAEIYLDKVSVLQSKYIALHAGIFWCVGRFIIKNGDTIKVMLESKPMYEHLSGGTSSDSFIDERTSFLNQLIQQRNLVVQYELIEPEKNIATRLL